MNNYSILYQSRNDLFASVNKISEMFILKFESNDEKTLFRCYFLDIELVIYKNTLDDDQGVEFSKYQYSLDVLKLSRGEGYKDYENMILYTAKYLAEKIKENLNPNTILIDDSFIVIDF